ncbi:hypothetical protein [Microbacterium lacticum]
MAKKPQKPKPTRLLSSVPNEVYERLIVSYPYRQTSDFAYFYEESAKRLASTYRGQAEDDVILLPFLFLYRQAFELQLKNIVAFLAHTRIAYVDGPSPELEQLTDTDYLKRTYGHSLHKLLQEAKKQYAALGMDEPFPENVEKFIMMLHEDDGSGMAFRYAGQLPNVQEHADFPDLVALFDENYSMLSVVVDGVDGVMSAAPTLNELADDY